MYLRLLFIGICCCQLALAQQKSFSGILHKSIKVTSHTNTISSEDWMRYFIESDSAISYYSPKGSKTVDKLYTRYYPANCDSNFLYDYNFDTLFHSKNRFVNKRAKITIEHLPTTFLGYECNKVITVADNYRTEKIFLDSSIYENGNSICLKSKYTDVFFSEEYEVFKIEETTLPDSIFQLPNLPKRRYESSSIYKSPLFRGGAKGWQKHLQTNLDASLGQKYIIVPAYEKFAKISVNLKFAIDKTGKIANVIVTNPFETHPKLAQEAIRVLMMEPQWQPGTYLGKPIPYLLIQKITFVNNGVE